jgi:thiamine biosynthesis lipoprotein
MTARQTQTEFALWGGRAVVWVTDPDALAPALDAVRSTVAAFDVACSTFREDSEITAVNAGAGEPVEVSALLLDAVEAALWGAQLTDGDLDPTVGQALIAYGFTPALGGTETGAPAGAERFRLESIPGWRVVTLDRDRSTIALPRGVRLDLGATAKGLAADRAAAAAAAAIAPAGVLVSLSGDISTAGAAPDGGWRVRVTDDHRSDGSAAGQWIDLHDGGLATSSTTVRVHGEGGDTAHHVIDPATGRPATVHFRTVSVAAASCLDANIASTTTVVRGARAVDWLEELGLPSRLVRADGTVLHVAGWPDGAEDLPLAEPVRGAA